MNHFKPILERNPVSRAGVVGFAKLFQFPPADHIHDFTLCEVPAAKSNKSRFENVRDRLNGLRTSRDETI